MLQITVNMCETCRNNMTFTTVEQKIAWNTLRQTSDTLILLKTAYIEHLEHSPATENLKN